MPVGPVTFVCFSLAAVFAFLRAKALQTARRHRTLEEPDEGRRPRFSGPKIRYTEEGKAHLQRAERYRALFFLFGLGSLAAAWVGW